MKTHPSGKRLDSKKTSLSPLTSGTPQTGPKVSRRADFRGPRGRTVRSGVRGDDDNG